MVFVAVEMNREILVEKPITTTGATVTPKTNAFFSGLGVSVVKHVALVI